jgi:hypothetical protein
MTISATFGVKPPVVFGYKEIHPKVINPKLIIGYELEIETTDTWDGHSEYRHDGESRVMNKMGWTITTDGSLRGVNNEFISKPMYSENALASLNNFFKVTGYGEENYSDRCSVHIHANCTDLTKEQVAALCLLYSVVEEPLFKFVGAYRDSNIYCIPWYQCRNHAEVVSNCIENPGLFARWQKYTALNLLPLTVQGTVEFRHMHGTADFGKLETWTNIVGSLIKNATERPLAEIQEEITNLNTSSNYKSFFERTLSGLLPFEDEYRATLENGVILAKYSLINREKRLKQETSRLRVSIDELSSIEDIRATANMLSNAQRNFANNWSEVTMPQPESLSPPRLMGRVQPVNIDSEERRSAIREWEIRESSRLQALINTSEPSASGEALVRIRAQAALRRAAEREDARRASRVTIDELSSDEGHN